MGTDDPVPRMPAGASPAASALYDHLLQEALQQCLPRARVETDPLVAPVGSDELLVEPPTDPCALTLRSFGRRHTLRVPPSMPFTVHEVRWVRAVASVLAARYRAILDPRVLAERGDLFRGFIEDRYVGAFVAGEPYRLDEDTQRADVVAGAIEVLRVMALSSYENRPVSSGVLLLAGDTDPCRPARSLGARLCPYEESLTAIKGFYRVADGLRTVFLVNRRGFILDVIDIARWADQMGAAETLPVPCAEVYRAHARATLVGPHVCIVLSPSREIKLFAEGAEVFTFRQAAWHLLDLEAKYERWAQAVGQRLLAERLFRTALDLADAREGALFVVLRNPADALPHLVAPADRLDERSTDLREGERHVSRRRLLDLLAGRTVLDLDRPVLAALATMDGATVTDPDGRLLAVGAILLHPVLPAAAHGWATEGARTTAALAATKFGPVLKVSEDGIISFYDGEKMWDI
jgi:hypothetical protein